MNVPASCLVQMEAFVEGLAPGKSFVGGTYGLNRRHLRIEELDVFLDHYHPISVEKVEG